jgi:hypothetical protein
MLKLFINNFLVNARTLVVQFQFRRRFFPHELAALCIELGLLWNSRGNTSLSQTFKQKAMLIYENSGALLRLKRLQSRN